MTMDFVAYNEIMICRKPIRNTVVAGVVTGYEFQIKYPSYRGCYLSCIEDLYFEVDGKRLEETEVFFGLNGKSLMDASGLARRHSSKLELSSVIRYSMTAGTGMPC